MNDQLSISIPKYSITNASELLGNSEKRFLLLHA